MQKNVLIADDHPVYLLGLITLLQTRSDHYRIVYEALNADEVMDRLAQSPVDIIITDLSMPGERHPDGLAMIQTLARRYPKSMVDVSDTPQWLLLASALFFFAELIAWGLRRQREQPPDTAACSADINGKAALTAALNQALKQVEQACDFLSRTSQDIRTPLNVVLGLLVLEKDRSENLTIAWQNAGLLRDLIDNILDLSRIEAGKLQLKPAPHPLWQTLHDSEANTVLLLQPVNEPNSTVTAPAPLPRRRIMIVDDFPLILTMLTLQLEKLGQEVIACESASAALAALSNTPVDMLITDCQMPDIDGYQLATLILIQDIAGTTPAPATLLSCTKNTQQEENDRARHAGMDGLLHKQFNTGGLRQVVLQYANPPGNTCDLTSLYQLADWRPEVIVLMRKQMRDVPEQDLQQLRSAAALTEKLSKLAHRLKASWNLFSTRETTRRCQAMEALPELLRAGLIEQALLPRLAERFTVLMNDSLIARTLLWKKYLISTKELPYKNRYLFYFLTV